MGVFRYLLLIRFTIIRKGRIVYVPVYIEHAYMRLPRKGRNHSVLLKEM